MARRNCHGVRCVAEETVPAVLAVSVPPLRLHVDRAGHAGFLVAGQVLRLRVHGPLLRELVVRDRSGTGQVHRTRDAVLRERMQDGADLVVDRDPAHVLAARSDAAPEPETEREQQSVR